MQDLPIEIRTKIFSQLSLKDFLMFGQSNKRYRKGIVSHIFSQNYVKKSGKSDYPSLQLHYLFSWISALNFLVKDKVYYVDLLKSYVEFCTLTIEQKTCAYGLLRALCEDDVALHRHYSDLLSSIKIEDKPLIEYLKNMLNFQLKKSDSLTLINLVDKFKILFLDRKRNVKNKIFLVNVFKCLDDPIVNKTLFDLIEEAFEDLNNNKVKKKSLRTLVILANDLPNSQLEKTAEQLCENEKTMFCRDDDRVSGMAARVMVTIIDRLPQQAFKLLVDKLLSKIATHMHFSIAAECIFEARAWELYPCQLSAILLDRVNREYAPATTTVFKKLSEFLPALPEAEFEKIVKAFLHQLAGNVQTSSSKNMIKKTFAAMPDYKKGLPIPLIESVLKASAHENMFYPLMLIEMLGYFAAYFDENQLKNFMVSLFPYFSDAENYLVSHAYEIFQSVIPNLDEKNMLLAMAFIHEKLNSPDKAAAIKALLPFLSKLPELSLKPLMEMLLRSLRSEDRNICKVSLNIIGQFPEKIIKKYFTQVMDTLVDKAASEDAKIFLPAIKALGQCSTQIISSQYHYLDQVIETLLDKAESEAVKVYQSAIAVLGKFATCMDKKYHQRIINILIDPKKATDLSELEPLIKGFIEFSFLIDDEHLTHVIDVLKKGAGYRFSCVSKEALRGFLKLEDRLEDSVLMPIVDLIFKVLGANSRNDDVFQLALDVLMKCLRRLSNEDIEKIKLRMENSSLHTFPETQIILLSLFWEKYYIKQFEKSNPPNMPKPVSREMISFSY